MKKVASWLVGALVLGCVLGLGWLVYDKIQSRAKSEGQAFAGRPGAGGGRGPGGPGGGRGGPVAVEVAPVTQGSIVSHGVFGGTLRPRAQFTVAPKVAGRVERLMVDVGDTVKRGDLIAKLDDDEYQQAVAEAKANLAVGDAQLAQANNALQIARREFERVQTLQQRGIASESELDQARSALEAAQAQAQVAGSQVQREQAALRAAEIRRSYTDVHAGWEGGDDTRVVGERFINEGDTVTATDPLVSVLEIVELYAQVFVAERDYGQLSVGQHATLTTDAFPERTFDAHVARLSPQFQTESRQALVELRVSNPQGLLKPGMYVRIEIDLARADDATLVPVTAPVRRQNQHYLFVAAEGQSKVKMVPVELGIQSGRFVQVKGLSVSGRVVTLGQQLLNDGSEIVVPADRAGQAGANPPPREAGPGQGPPAAARAEPAR
jgi:RND family efflux transporter MFP subunit